MKKILFLFILLSLTGTSLVPICFAEQNAIYQELDQHLAEERKQPVDWFGWLQDFWQPIKNIFSGWNQEATFAHEEGYTGWFGQLRLRWEQYFEEVVAPALGLETSEKDKEKIRKALEGEPVIGDVVKMVNQVQAAQKEGKNGKVEVSNEYVQSLINQVKSG